MGVGHNVTAQRVVVTVQHFGTPTGVKCDRSTAVKDELLISGNDVDMVSHSAALISGQCHVRKKDIRKFLDGIYIAERGLVVKVRRRLSIGRRLCLMACNRAALRGSESCGLSSSGVAMSAAGRRLSMCI